MLLSCVSSCNKKKGTHPAACQWLPQSQARLCPSRSTLPHQTSLSTNLSCSSCARAWAPEFGPEVSPGWFSIAVREEHICSDVKFMLFKWYVNAKSASLWSPLNPIFSPWLLLPFVPSGYLLLSTLLFRSVTSCFHKSLPYQEKIKAPWPSTCSILNTSQSSECLMVCSGVRKKIFHLHGCQH